MGWPQRFFRRFSSVKCVCFVSRPEKIATFHWTENDSQTFVVDFSGKRHISKKTWKSSRISSNRVTTTTSDPGNRRRLCVWNQEPEKSLEILHFWCFFIFFIFSSFSFMFFHFLSISFIFLHFSSLFFILCMFHHFSSCSFMFLHFLFIFLHLFHFSSLFSFVHFLSLISFSIFSFFMSFSFFHFFIFSFFSFFMFVLFIPSLEIRFFWPRLLHDFLEHFFRNKNNFLSRLGRVWVSPFEASFSIFIFFTFFIFSCSQICLSVFLEKCVPSFYSSFF